MKTVRSNAKLHVRVGVKIQTSKCQAKCQAAVRRIWVKCPKRRPIDTMNHDMVNLAKKLPFGNIT